MIVINGCDVHDGHSGTHLFPGGHQADEQDDEVSDRISGLYLGQLCMKEEVQVQVQKKVQVQVQVRGPGTVGYRTVQCSTVQYSTVQYSTVQYSTVQYGGKACIQAD